MVVGFNKHFMALEIGHELPCCGDYAQIKLLDFMITCIDSFEHFAYEIHRPQCLVRLLGKYWAHLLVHEREVEEKT